jgi:acyl carrier protein
MQVTAEQIQNEFIHLIKTILKRKEDLTGDTDLIKDLDLDSLDILEVLVEIQEKYNFDIPDKKDAERLTTIGSASAFIAELINKKA